MKQYIDKSVVVAEIKERINRDNEKAASFSSSSEHDYLCRVKEKVYKSLLSFLDTLEVVKEVDLGQEIKSRIDSLSNLYCYMEDLFDGKEEEGVYPIPEKVTNELFEFAKYFFELGLQKAM